MNHYGNPYQASQADWSQFAISAEESERTAFIRRTYTHLIGAILALVAIDTAIFTLVPEQTLMRIVGTMAGGYTWLVVLGAFMVVSWLANMWASSGASASTQYLGLSLYVIAESLILVPLLFVASRVGGGSVIPVAGLMTLVIFGGLTLMVFVTKADFSWLGRFLWLGGLVAMGFIVCAIFFNGNLLGTTFATAMVALAGGYILYDTSNVLHHYRTDQHVAASLALFASVALLFWYVLRIVMSLSRD